MTAAIPLSPLACWLIGLYQRYISPRKGFRCAYRARRSRRASCSEFARRAIARFGTLTGYELLRRRFAKCRHACRQLRGRAVAGVVPMATAATVLDYEPRKSAREQEKRDRRDSSSPSACDCVPDPGCGDFPLAAKDCGGADLLPDLGGVGTGAADCGGAACDGAGSCDFSL